MTLPTPDTMKLSLRIDTKLWAGWSKLSKEAGYEPIDYMRLMVSRKVMEAKPSLLDEDDKVWFERLDRLISKVVQIAVSMFKNGEFSQDITLHVFQRAMKDPAFLADYTAHIGGVDPYLHGNPLKEVNRELGWRIKNALPVEVMKTPGGKPDERRNLKGEVIQSYTLLRRIDVGEPAKKQVDVLES